MIFLNPNIPSQSDNPVAYIIADDLVDDNNNSLFDGNRKVYINSNGNILQLTPKCYICNLLKKETISKHGFRTSMIIAGVSFTLLVIPGLGWVLCPIIAGLAIISAATFFAYRHRLIAPKLNYLKESSDDDVLNAKLEGFVFPIISKKEDLNEGWRCLILIGAIQLYVKPFFNRYVENSKLITVKLE